MEFNGKNINIRAINKSDTKNVAEFLDFINSLIEEDTKIYFNKKFSFKEEKEYVINVLKRVKSKKEVFLIAEEGNRIVGSTSIELGTNREEHVGIFGIAIRNGYRRIGLGKYLIGEILKMAEKQLKPKPKMIRLTVFSNNKPAFYLYKKIGFKVVANVPKQRMYKGKLIDDTIMILYLA